MRKLSPFKLWLVKLIRQEKEPCKHKKMYKPQFYTRTYYCPDCDSMVTMPRSSADAKHQIRNTDTQGEYE